MTTRKRRTKAEMEHQRYCDDVDAYQFYLIEKANHRICSGWETKEESEEARLDFDIDENEKDMKEYQTVSKKKLKALGIENPNEKWKRL
jgi:hypothetical protein